MMMRGVGPHSQKDYVWHLKRMAAVLGCPSDTAMEEDLRRFQMMRHASGRPAHHHQQHGVDAPFPLHGHAQAGRSVAGAGDHAAFKLYDLPDAKQAALGGAGMTWHSI